MLAAALNPTFDGPLDARARGTTRQRPTGYIGQLYFNTEEQCYQVYKRVNDIDGWHKLVPADYGGGDGGDGGDSGTRDFSNEPNFPGFPTHDYDFRPEGTYEATATAWTGKPTNGVTRTASLHTSTTVYGNVGTDGLAGTQQNYAKLMPHNITDTFTVEILFKQTSGIWSALWFATTADTPRYPSSTTGGQAGDAILSIERYDGQWNYVAQRQGTQAPQYGYGRQKMDSNNAQDNQWHHLVWVYRRQSGSGSTATQQATPDSVWLNGTEVTQWVIDMWTSPSGLTPDQSAWAWPQVERNVFVGRTHWGDNATENVKFIRFWDKELNAAQAAWLYNTGQFREFWDESTGGSDSGGGGVDQAARDAIGWPYPDAEPSLYLQVRPLLNDTEWNSVQSDPQLGGALGDVKSLHNRVDTLEAVTPTNATLDTRVHALENFTTGSATQNLALHQARQGAFMGIDPNEPYDVSPPQNTLDSRITSLESTYFLPSWWSAIANGAIGPFSTDWASFNSSGGSEQVAHASIPQLDWGSFCMISSGHQNNKNTNVQTEYEIPFTGTYSVNISVTFHNGNDALYFTSLRLVLVGGAGNGNDLIIANSNVQMGSPGWSWPEYHGSVTTNLYEHTAVLEADDDFRYFDNHVHRLRYFSAGQKLYVQVVAGMAPNHKPQGDGTNTQIVQDLYIVSTNTAWSVHRIA